MIIVNVDTQIDKKLSGHYRLFADSIHATIVEHPGSGKTNVMYNLITYENGLKFENIYLYSKILNQEKYVLLKNIIDSVKGANLYTFTNGKKCLSLHI